MRYRLFLLLVLLLGINIGGVIRAQDTAPAEAATAVPTDIPTEVPTEIPTEVPTEVATEIPTEVPTDIPTDVPTEVPTDVPTDVPTVAATEQPTEEATETPTLEPTVEANLPPQFSLDGSSILDATAGVQTTFTLAVADEDGLVTVGRADNTSIASIVVTQATEAVAADPRFYTAVTVDYTAPADFVGADSFTLVAVDAANLSTTLTLTVNVALPETTPEATVEATAEATAAATTVPDQIAIINYNPAAPEKAIQAMLSALGAVEISRIPQIGAMKVKLAQAVNTTAAAANVLSRNVTAQAAGVISIEPEIIYHTAAFPNDTLYPTGTPSINNQWSLMDYTQVAGGTNTNYAWGISVKDGTGVTVAVLDTGIDTTHPDLVGKMLPGWNFVADTNNTDDDNGHGTAVAGIIAANTNNTKGIAGVAFNAKLLPVKVCDASNTCSAYDMAAGIVFATDKGAKVANISLAGATQSTTLGAAVQYAIYRNMTIVAAAGNDGGTGFNYPASYPGVISVAAHDIDGNHWTQSTANNLVTVSAPGVGIITTVPLEYATCTVDNDPVGVSGPEDFVLPDGYCNFDGTSMAAAEVTGVVALAMSDNVVKSPAAALEAVRCSAYDSGGDGVDPEFGYGLVQADMAQNWSENSGYVCKPTVPNDLYQNATNIPSVPFTTTMSVDERTVTHSASDPFDAANAGFYSCGQADRTVWFKFKPTVSDYYQITTLGSTYDTDLSIWQLPEEGNTSTNFIACNDQSPEGYSDASYVNAALTAGQTYYIMVSNYWDGIDPLTASPMSDSLLVLDVRRAMFNNNVDYQENAPNIYYLGSWVQTPAAGASGGSVKSTTDLDAIAVFTFRGVALDIARTIGPTQGDMILLVDGLPYYIVNKGVILKRNQVEHIPLCPCNTPGLWHQAVLTRAGSPGSVDIDRIRTFEAEELPTASITALTDDALGGTYPCATRKFCYTGGAFTPMIVTGANMGKVTQTTVDQATVSFRATGSTITIFRTTNVGFGTMDVQVDGELIAIVSNESAALHAKVPYVISGLGAYSHVVQLINTAGSTLQFDAAQASSPAAIAASPTVLTNENAPTLIYGGFWSNLPTPGAVGNTLRQTVVTPADLDEPSTVTFNYTGNWFLVSYRLTNPGATVDVYVDNQIIATITDPGGSGGAPVTWDSKIMLGLGSDRTHNVRLVVTSGTFAIDSVAARRQAIITPSMGVVQETNTAIAYNTVFGAWVSTNVKSLGGYVFQGGLAKRATTAGANLSFYMNGTGFILYTSMGPSQDAWEVLVDGVVYPMIVNDVSFNYLDLHLTTPRFRPFAYAITGLTPGIHTIKLTKVAGAGPGTGSIDFDAVRVFP